jgi:hypothetical protein
MASTIDEMAELADLIIIIERNSMVQVLTAFMK